MSIRIGEQLIAGIPDVSDKLDKSGGTMTGNLVIQKDGSTASISLKRLDFDYTTTETPSENIELSNIYFRDLNGKTLGFITSAFDTSNRIRTRLGARRSIDGIEKTNYFDISIDNNGKPYYNRPQLITTYVSGTSGYNIWSNGYCEQWGRSASGNGITVTLPKTYKDTNYNISLTLYANGRNMDGNWAPYNIKTITSGNAFVVHHYNGDGIAHWRTCGYLASDQY